MSHSIAHLKLMARAKQRLNAGQGLLNCKTTLAAVAACWSSDGEQILKDTQNQLIDQANAVD